MQVHHGEIVGTVCMDIKYKQKNKILTRLFERMKKRNENEKL